MSRSIIVFAQIPPPEHGQSRMIAEMLRILHDSGMSHSLHHIDARFSLNMDEIGERSLGKLFLSIRYVLICLRLRLKLQNPTLYYVPGPVKWSSVIRDWILLSLLRPFFPRVIFHWHAIGQGEWAHGSSRLSLPGSRFLDRCARTVSRMILNEPALSIAVSRNSTKDARAIGSWEIAEIPNGLEDPFPDFDSRIHKMRSERAKWLANHPSEPLHLLFLSRGTVEKGITDALNAIKMLLSNPSPFNRPLQLTIAGGMDGAIRDAVMDTLRQLVDSHGVNFQYEILDFVQGETKSKCYELADLFLAPSRWESFGLTVTEAMACGLPVIAAGSDGVSGILPDQYPYLSPVGDVKAFADNIAKAHDAITHHNYNMLATSLRTQFTKSYTFEIFTQNIRSVFTRETTADTLAMNGNAEKEDNPLTLSIYLADQNARIGRSLGISRMTHVVMQSLGNRDDIRVTALSSRSSILPSGVREYQILPWKTKSSIARLLTDNLHPVASLGMRPDVWYYPKGFLPALHILCTPSVVTIHDTIVQYYADRYPSWRIHLEYSYWGHMLKNTLIHADEIMTVSKHSKSQIENFIERHQLPKRNIHVTYEPCIYESTPQPQSPEKSDYVMHLGSFEPHKRTKWLIEQWIDRAGTDQKMHLPKLHVIGRIPEDILGRAEECDWIVHLPFLQDHELVRQYAAARALILPSEIEGFGLPALESYYLGTPACFVRGTSVEEILELVTTKGGFDLTDTESLWSAVDDVLAMPDDEIHSYGTALRNQFHSSKIVEDMAVILKRAARKGN